MSARQTSRTRPRLTPIDELVNTLEFETDGVVRVRHDLTGPRDEGGWHTALIQLRQSYGMCWELDADEAVTALVGACDGATPLAAPVSVLAAALGRESAEVAAALLPVVRDLVQRGFLLPPDGAR